MTILLAPTDEVLIAALAAPDGCARLAAAAGSTGAVAILFGADRFGADRFGEAGAGAGGAASGAVRPRIEPSVAAVQFGLEVPGFGLLVAAGPGRDHPYNLARRILSADQLLDGRLGVVVGLDRRADAVAGSPWTSAPLSAGLVEQFAAVVRGLWNSWPDDAVVGDRVGGVFVDSDRIRKPVLRGAYDVDGPLTTPSGRQKEPVLLGWDGSGGGQAEGSVSFDATAGAASGDRIELVRLDLIDLPERPDPEVASRPTTRPAVERPTLRELLGLPPRALDTSGWERAFTAEIRKGAA